MKKLETSNSEDTRSRHQHSGSEQVLADLIARLEKATGPDRILDAEICVAARMVPPHVPWLANFSDWRATGHCVQAFNDAGESCANWNPSDYTRSIDAALTLVPEDGDSFWHVRMDRHSDGWYVAVWDVKKHKKFFGEQKPQALAICIAALRARHSRTDDRMEGE